MSQFDSHAHDESPKQKAMNNGHKPAAVHLTDGTTIYAEFAEMRDGHAYVRDVQHMDDEEIVGEYIPFDKLQSMTRLQININGER